MDCNVEDSGVTGATTSRGVCILGSTGSIGISTLDVLARHSDKFHIVALSANRQVERLFEQCQRYQPRFAVMADESSAVLLAQKIRQAGLNIEVMSGTSSLESIASNPESDIVMAAIVGAAGLLPTLAAVHAGKRVLLANKEPLVMCGHLFLEAAAKSGAELLPIDSEHNAIFQCMPAGYRSGTIHEGVCKILLTCSGGPFRASQPEQLKHVTPEQACAHPNWSMGKKISVDSATLMNKGLELIEACWLFHVQPKQVQIVIHPESVIHSMVEYLDGSVLAQLGNPDMRTPIAHALAWPGRIESGVKSLDLFDVAALHFESPSLERFPCLELAYRAAETRGTAAAIMNAANEVAVQAFLDRHISFTAIPEIIAATMDHVAVQADAELEAVLAADAHARAYAQEVIATPQYELSRSKS